MKIRYILVTIFLIIVISCNKDKFQTKPQITIKSYSTEELPPQGQMTITFEYTDKEGDVGSGQFIYYPKRLNIIPYTTNYPDSVVSQISSSAPNKQKGEITLTLDWINLHLSDAENDTIQLQFVLVDRAGHRSDSVASDKLVILRN